MQTLDSTAQTAIDNKIYDSNALSSLNIIALAEALRIELDYSYDEILNQEYSDDLLGVESKDSNESWVGRIDYSGEGEACFYTVKLKLAKDGRTERYYCHIRCEDDPRQDDNSWIRWILNVAPGAKNAKILVGYQDAESPHVIADVTILAELYI